MVDGGMNGMIVNKIIETRKAQKNHIDKDCPRIDWGLPIEYAFKNVESNTLYQLGDILFQTHCWIYC